jgi:AraC-like DNA-binding protein
MGLSFHFEYYVALLSALVAVLLFFAHREKSLSPRILAAYFLCASYMLFLHTLVRYGDFIYFPHLWRTNEIVGMLNPALAFIYVRSVLEQRYQFRRSDIVLLSLSIIMVFCFLHFYMQPADYKRTVILTALSNKSVYVQANEGILPPGVALLTRSTFGIIMIVCQFVLLYRWYTRTRPLLPNSRQNLNIFRWLLFLSTAIGLTFCLLIGQHIFQFFHEKDFYWVISTTLMTTLFSTLIYLFLQPAILYGLQGWSSAEETSFAPGPPVETKKANRRADSSKADSGLIREKVEQHLTDNKPFIARGYAIANLSAEIGVPLYQLSAFINQQYGQSFNEFINGYRIKYIKEVLLKEPGVEHYTLEALGKKAGFNSRSTFIAAVKKQTGQTPSAFLQDINLDAGS